MNGTHAPEQLREALVDARQQLQDMYGHRLRRVILYGSQARGNAREDSDIDVLVVLDEGANRHEEFKRLSVVTMDLFERYRLTFSLMPYDEDAYHDLRRPFMQDVHAEGIDLLPLYRNGSP